MERINGWWQRKSDVQKAYIVCMASFCLSLFSLGVALWAGCYF